MPNTAWLIGSVPLAAQSLTIAAMAEVIAAGNYYLRNGTATLSLVDAFRTAMSNAGVTLPVVQVLQTRQVRISGGANFTVTWGSATTLRDLLGFTQGNLSGADEYTADSVSPLLWSPGFRATPKTIPGVDGYTKTKRSVHKSADGTKQERVIYGQETWQDLEWALITTDRMRVDAASDGGGTFHEFYEQCVRFGYLIDYYEEIFESTSASAVTWGTAYGPYVTRDDDGDWYQRVVANTDDVGASLRLLLHKVDEYA